MTESSQQEFFLDYFQKVRDLLDGGDAKKALGVMLDVRENGFVNKELDTMIDSLRGDPPAEVVQEALRWSDTIIERLKSFGGDVFQLVEEFSEASLGLSEAEWVPVDTGAEGAAVGEEPDDLLSMDFDGVDDMAFDLELDEVSSEDIDLDFSDDDGWGDWGEIDEIGGDDGDSDLGDADVGFSLLEDEAEETAGEPEEQEVPAPVDFALVEGTLPLEMSDVTQDSEVSEASEVSEEEPPAVLSRKERETKPNQAITGDEPPRDALLRETARRPAAQKEVAEEREESFADAFADFDFDDSEPVEETAAEKSSRHGFVEEATRRSDPLKDVLSERSASEPQSEASQADEDEEDDFDFDLGFENPAGRIETPSAFSAVEENDGDEDDDFDFDLGFENPAARVQTPTGTPAHTPVWNDGKDEAVDDKEEEDDDFDFDLGFENPESKNQQVGRLVGGSLDSKSDVEHELDFDLGGLEEESAEKDSSDGEGRDPEATPASMPSIPRFRPPTEEERSAAKSKSPTDSLDDDEFFELAESLAGESSETSHQSAPYRGEPLMHSSGTPMPSSNPTPTPVPRASAPPAKDLSEASQGRARADTPNPFAHDAPTGVQRALVDSHSSFVLEEIRDSEVSEAEEREAAVGALLSEARRLYEKGKFESAHDLVEAVLERDGTNEDARELMSAVEGELERQYQAQLGSLSKVPELKVSMSEIPSMNLDHRFGYLLSQIDGMSCFEDIIELSSMTRLETLEVLTQMLERDIIEIG